MKDNEKKNQNTEGQQEQTPKKESFLKRTCKRFGRDCLDIAIGGVIGGVIVGAIFKARSGNATEETAAEDQETEDEEDVSEEDSEE